MTRTREPGPRTSTPFRRSIPERSRRALPVRASFRKTRVVRDPRRRVRAPRRERSDCGCPRSTQTPGRVALSGDSRYLGALPVEREEDDLRMGRAGPGALEGGERSAVGRPAQVWQKYGSATFAISPLVRAVHGDAVDEGLDLARDGLHPQESDLAPVGRPVRLGRRADDLARPRLRRAARDRRAVVARDADEEQEEPSGEKRGIWRPDPRSGPPRRLPARCMSQIRFVPSRADTKAIVFPSGETEAARRLRST